MEIQEELIKEIDADGVKEARGRRKKNIRKMLELIKKEENDIKESHKKIVEAKKALLEEDFKMLEGKDDRGMYGFWPGI